MIKDVSWPLRPRTSAKLQILKSYIGAWFQIVGKRFDTALYFDGFCGPGVYSGGEDGSPVIAVKEASASCEANQRFRPILLFNDNDQKACESVTRQIEMQNVNNRVQWHVTNKEFWSYADTITTQLRGQWTNPMFSFIDPFGIKDTPFSSIEKLLEGERSECLINFMAGWANRFVAHPDLDVAQKVEQLLGGSYVDQVLKADDRIGTIIQLYQEKLHRQAPFVKSFLLIDEGNVRDNVLIFCSKNSLGFQKMKEAMWRVDPERGGRFSAREALSFSRGQQNLFGVLPVTHPLKNEIRSFLEHHGRCEVGELMAWVDSETGFLRKHARIVLTELHAAGEITAFDPDGDKLKAGQWPNRVVVAHANG